MQTNPGQTGDNTLLSGFSGPAGEKCGGSQISKIYTRELSRPQQSEKVWGKSVHEAQIYKNASLKRDFSVTKSSKKGQLTGP
ncbi:hypothetical protein [Escherichia coli]|uniref:hypothetical protein n=1 Tax=Escherichia coli TaxID=562 RepID=UPI001655AADF|nr:hypothetical protein [Escherichia coli]